MASLAFSPKKTPWLAHRSATLTRGLTGLLVAGLLALQGCASRDDGAARRHDSWVASWGTAQLAVDTPAASIELPAVWREPLADVSLRQVVRLSLGGQFLRVQISNALGRTPLEVSAAAVSLSAAPSVADQQPQLQAASTQALRFGGRAGIRLEPGEEAFSDPVALSAVNASELAVDLHIVHGTSPATAHPGSRIQSWAMAGNAVGRSAWPGAAPRVGWWHLAAVDVQAADSQRQSLPVLVAIGDSITDGYGVTNAGYRRWTDTLVRRLTAEGRPAAVVNTGIGGNRLLRDGLGPRVVQRFDRDALQRSGATHAVLLVGVNDLGVQRRNGQDTPEARAALLQEMRQAFTNLASRAHAAGVCLIAATVLPYGASGYYKPTADNEADRVALNSWLRNAPVFDAVVDFDAVTRDPAQPARLLQALDSGDGLHPSMAGYDAMAASFPLSVLDRSCRQAAP